MVEAVVGTDAVVVSAGVGVAVEGTDSTVVPEAFMEIVAVSESAMGGGCGVSEPAVILEAVVKTVVGRDVIVEVMVVSEAVVMVLEAVLGAVEG